MTAAVDVYVSAGSNIEPEENLRMARRELADKFGLLALSSVYRTKAVGFDGDDFLNLVFSFSTELDIHSVNTELENLEAQAGRTRFSDPFTPRTLDLDLLLYGDDVRDEGKLRVPREDILKYAFVLAPMAELAPELRHPVDGRKMRDLWSVFVKDDQEIERLAEPLSEN